MLLEILKSGCADIKVRVMCYVLGSVIIRKGAASPL